MKAHILPSKCEVNGSAKIKQMYFSMSSEVFVFEIKVEIDDMAWKFSSGNCTYQMKKFFGRGLLCSYK